MEILVRPIGVIHSPFTETTPVQTVRSHAIDQAETYPEFTDGLKDIKELFYIHLLHLLARRLAQYKEKPS